MDEPMRKTIRRCPHCDGLLAVYSNISVQAGEEGDKADWRTGLAAEQLTLVESAERTGMMKSFIEAMNEAKKGGVPKQPQRFFLEFIKNAVPRIIPQVCMDELNDVLRNERIEVYGHQGIAVVVGNGEIRWFVPYDLMRGRPMQHFGNRSGASRKRLPVDEIAFSEWIRTRHGYVAGKGLYLQAMRKRSIGDYARLVQ